MIWILDNGHGGMVGGQYVTPGKRSPKWEDLPQLFEGVFNRQLVALITSGLKKYGISFHVLVPEQTDISLSERVARVNEFCKNSSPAALLSIHGNGSPNLDNPGTGWEVWTSKGQTKSDELTAYFYAEMSLAFPEKRMRADFTDDQYPDKDANFYILRYTVCPALLTENFFMDNKEDCRLMLSREGKILIANAHINAIRRIEKVYKKLACNH